MAITATEAQAFSEDELAEMIARRKPGVEYLFPLRAVPVGSVGERARLVRGREIEDAEYAIVKAEDDFRAETPPALQNFQERNKGETSFSVEWDAFPLRGAQIFVSSDGGTNYVEAGHADHHQFTGLSAGTEYTFSGYTIRRMLSSTAQMFTASTESADQKPAPPSGLTAIVFGNAIIVEWEAEAGNNYEIQFNAELYVPSTQAGAHGFVGVVAGTHTIRVRAVHDGVRGDPATVTATVT